MNDFTKEELETMAGCVFGKWVNSLVDPSIQHLTVQCKYLGDKIQSMIDNYCEHDGEIGKDYPAEKCMKCGAYWE